jgi:hypothetical protein
MARYKVLKSVAHSLAHSFTSALNWGDADYVMGNLLQRARDIGAGTLEIDLISGAAEPSALCTPPVQRAVERYTEWLRRLVMTHKSDMRYVAKATLTIQYDLNVARPAEYPPTGLESPYECTAEITDDRGTMWKAVLCDWWVPQPLRPSPTARRWWEFWKPAA